MDEFNSKRRVIKSFLYPLLLVRFSNISTAECKVSSMCHAKRHVCTIVKEFLPTTWMHPSIRLLALATTPPKRLIVTQYMSFWLWQWWKKVYAYVCVHSVVHYNISRTESYPFRSSGNFRWYSLPWPKYGLLITLILLILQMWKIVTMGGCLLLFYCSRK